MRRIAAVVTGVRSVTVMRASRSGCSGSGGDCGAALDQLHQAFHWIPPFTAPFLALPILAGMFWGAPLVAREYEAGTHRLAWTQSISPTRWIAVKMTLVLGTAAAAAITLGALTTWALTPLAPAFGTRFNSTWFDIQGLVPVACMLFALSLGIAASAVIRRTIPAMAITLVAFAAARFPLHFFREHFAPIATRTVHYPLSDLLKNPDGDGPPVSSGARSALNDWILRTTRFDPAGHPISTHNNRDILLQYCPELPARGDIPPAAAKSCLPRLEVLTGRETTAYQPAGHFWHIQTVESLIFLALTGLLVLVTVLAITRRRPT